MKNHNWKLLGLMMALAMLCACLFGGAALADGEETPYLSVDVWHDFGGCAVMPDNELIIKNKRPVASDGQEPAFDLNISVVKLPEETQVEIDDAQKLQYFQDLGEYYTYVPCDQLVPFSVYRATVTAHADGYTDAESSVYFVAGADENVDGYGLSLKIEPSNPSTREDVSVWRYLDESATDFKLYINGAESENVEWDDNRASFTRQDPEHVVLFARAQYYNENSNNYFWITSNICEFDFINRLVGLDVSLSAYLVAPDENVPVEIYINPACRSNGGGEDIEYYRPYISCPTDESQNNALNNSLVPDENDGFHYTLPAANLTPGYEYKVYVNAKADGYEETGRCANFTVINKDGAYPITLECSAEITEDRYTANYDDDIRFTLTDVDENTDKWLYFPGDNVVYFNYDDNSGTWYFDYHCDRVGNMTVYARACFRVQNGDGEEYHYVTSDAIELNVINTLTPPRINNMPNQTDVGDDMCIYFDPAVLSDGSPAEISHALTIVPVGGGDAVYGPAVPDQDDQGRFTMPANTLEAGKAYEATVTASLDGYGDVLDSRAFLVNESRDGYGIGLNINGWDPSTGDNVQVWMNSPGADIIELYDNNSSAPLYTWENNDAPEYSYTQYDPGHFMLYARAHLYDGEGDEEGFWVTSNVCELDFTNRLIDLDIALSDYLVDKDGSENVAISIVEPRPSNNREVAINYSRPYIYCRTDISENDALNDALVKIGDIHYSLPTENLTPGYEYEVSVNAKAEGYEETGRCVSFIVVRNDETHTVTLAASDDAVVNRHYDDKRFTLEIQSEDEAKEAWLFVNGENRGYIDLCEEPWHFDYNCQRTGDMKAYARVRFGNDESSTWITTNLVEFTVLPTLEDWNINLPDEVELGDDLDINYNTPRISDNRSANINFTLSVVCMNNGDEVFTKNAPDAEGLFAVPVDGENGFIRGFSYRATVTGAVEGMDGATGERSANFWVRQQVDGFNTSLNVDNYDIFTNQDDQIHVNASGIVHANWLQLWDGDHMVQEWLDDELDEWGNASYCYYSECEAQAKFYTIAEFTNTYNNEKITIASPVHYVNVRTHPDAEPTGGAAFEINAETTPVSVTRGELLGVNVDITEAPEGGWLSAEIQDSEGNPIEGYEFYDMPSEGNSWRINVPTVNLEADAQYKLLVWWRNHGHPVDNHGEENAKSFAVTEADEVVFGVTGLDYPIDASNGDTVPRRAYTLYAYYPGDSVDGLCIFENGQVGPTFSGNSFAWDDQNDYVVPRTYTLGTGRCDQEGNWDWTETEYVVNVGIVYDGDLLPVPTMSLTANCYDEDEGTWNYVELGDVFYQDIYSQGLRVELDMLDWEGNEPDDYAAQEVDYRLELHDCTDGYREVWSDNTHLWENEDPDEGEYYDHYERQYVWPDNGFQVGHEYEMVARAYYRNYPASEEDRHGFIVLPGLDDRLTLAITDNDTDEGLNFDASEVIEACVTVPEEATAVQIFWDGEWRIMPREFQQGDGTWLWHNSLDGCGDQRIMARVTSNGFDEDCWDEWKDSDWSNNLYWYAYSNIVGVHVYDAEKVVLPALTIKNPEVNRGDGLEIVVGACEEGVRGYELRIMGRNDNGDYYDDFGDLSRSCWGEDVKDEHTFSIPTATLRGEETRYRVELRVHANKGYRYNVSDYDDEDFYFTVISRFNSGIRITGDGVVEHLPDEDDGEHYFTVPTCSEYTVTGYLEEDIPFCLREWNVTDRRGDECFDANGEDYITWRRDGESRKSQVGYAVCKQDDRGEWTPVDEVTLHVTAENTLPEINLDYPASVTLTETDEGLKGRYEFRFQPVEHAEGYYLELTIDEDWTHFYERDFNPVWNKEEQTYKNLPEEISYDVDSDEVGWFHVAVDLPQENSDEDNGQMLPDRYNQICAVVVNAFARNYDRQRAEHRFITLPEDDEKLGLKLNSQNQVGNLYVNVPFDVTVTLPEDREEPNGLWISFEGDEPRRVERRGEDENEAWKYVYTPADAENDIPATLTFVTDQDWPCETSILVWASYDDKDIYSDPQVVNFTVKEGHELKLPSFEIVNENWEGELKRGDVLKLAIGDMAAVPENVEALDGSEWTLADIVDCYSVQVYDAEGEQKWDSRLDVEYPLGTAEVFLDTLPLWENKYRLRFEARLTDEAWSDGWFCETTDEEDEDLWFTVRDEKTKPEMALTVDGKRVVPDDDGVITVYADIEYEITALAPGQRDGVCVYFDDDDEQDPSWWSGGGDMCRLDDRRHGGIHTYTLGTYDRGELRWVRSGVSLTIDVQEYGELPDPVIELDRVFVQGVDDFVFKVNFSDVDTNGQPIRTRVEHNVEWWNTIEEDPLWDADECRANLQEDGYHIPADAFVPGETYFIRAWAYAPGYDNEGTGESFLVVEALDPNLALTVNEQPDKAYVLANDNAVNICLNYSGSPVNPEAWDAVQLYWNGEWRDESFPIENRSLEAGEYIVSARVRQTEEAEWKYSNSVIVTATTQGEQVGLPNVALNAEDGLVNPGDTLHVTLTGLKTLKDADNVKGIEVCLADRWTGKEYWYNNEGDWVSMEDIEASIADDDTAYTVTFDTAQLYDSEGNECALPVGEYRVDVYVQGKPGHPSSWIDDDDEAYWFDVPIQFGLQAWTENQETHEWAWSDPDNSRTVDTCQEVCIRAMLPAYGGPFAVMMNNEDDDIRGNWDWYDEDGATYMGVGTGDAGDYTFTLCRWEDDGWEPIEGMTLSLTVIAPNGDLPDPVLRVDNTFTEGGEYLEFQFDEVVNKNGDVIGQAWYNIEARVEAWEYNLFRDYDGVHHENEDWDGDTRVYDSGDNSGASITYAAGVDGAPGTYTVRVPMTYVDNDGQTQSRVPAGMALIVEVGGCMDGYNCSNSEREVLVVKDLTDSPIHLAITPTISDPNPDENGVLNVLRDEDMQFTLSIDDAAGKQISEVQIWWDEEWKPLNKWEEEDRWWPFGDNRELDFTNPVTFTEGVDNTGEYNFQARARIDNGEDYVYSNVVAVSVTAMELEELPTVALTNLVHGGLPRGEQLEVEFANTPENGAAEYMIYVRDAGGYDEFARYAYAAEDGTVYVPTYDLPQNRDYWIEVKVIPDVGYNGARIGENAEGYRFHVNKGDPVFSVDNDNPFTYQEIILSAYVLQADRLRIECREGDRLCGSREGDGNSFAWINWWEDHEGTFTFKLFQWSEADNDWVDVTCQNEVGETVPIQPITVNVQHKGKLDDPIIYLVEGNKTSLMKDGMTWEADKKLTFRVAVDDRVAGDHLHLDMNSDDGDEIFGYEQTEDRVFTVDPNRMRVEQTYRIWAFTWKEGYTCSDAEVSFMVVPSAEGKPTLTMTVNGSGESPMTLPTAKDYRIDFQVNQPETDDPEAEAIVPDNIQLTWDGEWWDMVPTTSGRDSRDWGQHVWYYPGTMLSGVVTTNDWECNRSLRMRMWFDDIGEWLYSDEIKLNIVAANGRVATPEVTWGETGPDVGSQVARGTILKLKVALPNPDAEDEDGRKDDRTGVSQLKLVLYTDDDGDGRYEDRREEYSVHVSATDKTPEMPTAALEEGRWYRLAVEAQPQEGYDGSESDGMLFQVAAPVDSRNLTVSKDHVETCENFTVTGFVPNGDRIALFWKGSNDSDWRYLCEANGDAIFGDQSFQDSGVYTYRLAAYNYYNDSWITYSEPELTVTVGEGAKLADADIEIVGGNMVQGEEFNFIVHEVENATDYSIGLFDSEGVNLLMDEPDSDEHWYKDYQASLFTDGELSIHVDGSMFDGYTPGEDRFTIRVTARGRGYESSTASYDVLLTEAPDDTLELTCSAGSEALVNDEVVFTLSCGADTNYTEAEIDIGDGGWEPMTSVEGGFTYKFTSHDIRRRTINAQARTGDGSWTPCAPVTVNFTGQEVPEFTVTLNTKQPRKGDGLTVSINMADGADRNGIDHFGVSICGRNNDEESEYFDFYHIYNEGGQEAVVNRTASGMDLYIDHLDVGGNYRVAVVAYGVKGVADRGTDDYDDSLYFTVKQRVNNNASFKATVVEPIMVGESYGFTAFVPGATHIEVFANSDAENPFRQADGESLTASNLTMDAAGTVTYSLVAWNGDEQMELENCEPIAVEAHAWGTVPTYKWRDGNGKCTATLKCGHPDCAVSTHVQEETVDSVYTEDPAPTCTQEGQGYWSATFKNPVFESQTLDPVVVPALGGHDWGDWRIVWDEADAESATAHAERSCKRENCDGNEAVETYPEYPVITVSEDPTETYPASCTQPGKKTYKATIDGSEIKDSKEEVTLAALGHDLVHHDGKAATCTEVGWEEYDTCTRCDYTTYVEIPKLNHIWGEWTIVWDSADANGATAHAERVCKRENCDGIDAVETYPEDPVITVSEDPTETYPASCTVPGKKTYKAAITIDGKEFNGSKEVTLAALGHDWGNWKIVWDSYDADGATAHAERVCQREHCDGIDAVETYPVDPVITVSDDPAENYPATCTVAGKKTYKATIDGSEIKDSKEVTLAALGHDLVHHDGKAATCTEVGWEEYDTCTRCDYTTYEEIPILNHLWSDWTIVWDSYDANGATAHAERVCQREDCDGIDAVETYPEDPVITVSEDPTETYLASCTVPGKKTYKAAITIDGKEFNGSKEVTLAALGHDWGNWKIVWDSYDADGATAHAERVCQREHCDGIDAVETQALSDENISVSTDPTENYPASCTEPGKKTYKATIDGSEIKGSKEVTLAALGHDLVHHDGKAATCTEVGWEEYDTCTRCDYTTYVEIPKLNHIWGEWTIVWDSADANGATAHAERSCKRENCDRIDAVETYPEDPVITVSEDPTETYPATCTVPGKKTYKAAITIDGKEFNGSKEVTLDALNHDWGNWTIVWDSYDADGATAHAERSCQREDCDGIKAVETQALSDENIAASTDPAKTYPATCTVAGKITYEAAITIDGNEVKGSKEVTLAALSHDWGDWTIVWDSADANGATAHAQRSCQRDNCDAVETQALSDENISVSTDPTETYPASCTVPGKKTYKAAITIDGKEFKGSKEVTLDALNHEWGDWTIVWDSADADGATAHAERSCQREDCDGIKAVETQALSDENISVSTDPAKTYPATCEADGKKTWIASVTIDGHEITDSRTVTVNKLGHDYQPAYDWNTENAGAWTVTARLTCTHNGLCSGANGAASTTTTEPGAMSGEVTRAATCSATGVRTWTATFTNNAFTTQNRDETIAIDPNAHQWGAPAYEWKQEDGVWKATATRACAHNGEHKETETVTATSAVKTPATCDGMGTTTYTATFANTAFATQTKEVQDIATTGHDWNAPVFKEWSGDYSKATWTRTCKTNPAHVDTVTVDTTSAITVNATCEAAGKRTYSAEAIIDGTKYTNSTQVDIPALGHDWGDVKFTWNGYTATAAVICKRDASHTNALQVTMSNAVTTQPTCTDAGVRTYTAKAVFNGKEYTDTRTEPISATGHSWNAPSYVWSDDNKTVTASVTCNNGNHPVVEQVNTTAQIVDATYTEKGQITYTATFTNPLFTTQTKVVEIPVKVDDAVVDVTAKINNLPANAGLEDKAIVEEARAAYNALTDAQKALISDDVLARLTTAEAQVKAAEEAAKQAEDEAAAKAVTDAINALPAKAGVGDKAKVQAARAAYEALTEDQKALISAKVLKKLTTAEDQVKAAEAEAKKVKLSKCKITISNLTYTGKALKPKVTVKYGTKKLKEKRDYTLTYDKKIVKIGTWKVTVTGIGNYTGTKDLSFKVNPIGTKFRTKTGGKKQITLKWSRPKNITGYQIQYSQKDTYTGKTTNKVTIKSAKTVARTFKGLADGKRYYVRIRTYKTVSGKTYYSAWSATEYVDTKGASTKNGAFRQVEMNVGEELDLKEMLSQAASESIQTWTTSDAEIAMVSQDGFVTALKPGEAVITAISEDGGQTEITVKVSAEGIILLDLGDDLSILDIDDVFDGEVDFETDIELPGA